MDLVFLLPSILRGSIQSKVHTLPTISSHSTTMGASKTAMAAATASVLPHLQDATGAPINPLKFMTAPETKPLQLGQVGGVGLGTRSPAPAPNPQVQQLGQGLGGLQLGQGLGPLGPQGLVCGQGLVVQGGQGLGQGPLGQAQQGQLGGHQGPMGGSYSHQGQLGHQTPQSRPQQLGSSQQVHGQFGPFKLGGVGGKSTGGGLGGVGGPNLGNLAGFPNLPNQQTGTPSIHQYRAPLDPQLTPGMTPGLTPQRGGASVATSSAFSGAAPSGNFVNNGFFVNNNNRFSAHQAGATPLSRGCITNPSYTTPADEGLVIQPNVEYFSHTHGRWVPAICCAVNSDGSYRWERSRPARTPASMWLTTPWTPQI